MPKFGKTRWYDNVSFSPSVMLSALEKLTDSLTEEQRKFRRATLSFWSDGNGQTIIQDPDAEHLRDAFSFTDFDLTIGLSEALLGFERRGSRYKVVTMGFTDANQASLPIVELDANLESSRLPVENALRDIKVFIGHGRSKLWRDLKDHLTDQHHTSVVAYEAGARAGYTIHEVLGEMADVASLALLVLTAEDIDKDGVQHARENVVHETGLFQGKLGLKRAIVMLEDGCNEFSNIAGLQQLRFSKGNIRETFGDVVAILRREFGTPTSKDGKKR